MGIVYQLTFFVSLGMLGIVVAVFVFAVTQVGSATKSAAKEQESKMLEKRKATLPRIESLEEKLGEAKRSGELNVPGLSSEIEETKEELESYDAEIKRVKERVVLITRKGAVVYPAGLFLVALALSITSSGLAGNESLGTLALWVWAISLVPLVLGVYRVYRSLGAIEEVTIASEEALDKLPAAVKSALRELDEEKKPELVMSFIGEEPPIRMVVGQEKEVTIGITLTKGEVARKPQVVFCVPTGFEFLEGARPMIQPKEVETVGGMLSGFCDFKDCRRGTRLSATLRLKAHSEAGVYEFIYIVGCEGFEGDYGKMEVVVVEVEEG